MYITQADASPIKMPDQYRYNVPMNRVPPVNMMPQPNKLVMSPVDWDGDRYSYK